jgi:hypothetical protein
MLIKKNWIMKQIQTKYLTDTQIMRKVISITKKWLRERGLGIVQIQFIRGTYHITNAGMFLLTAKYILQSATGLKFIELSYSMAKLDKSNS